VNICTIIFLVGGGNNSSSTPTLSLVGLSLFSDDNDCVVISSPITRVDDETDSTIAEENDTIDNDFPRLRKNSSPSTFSSLKNAFFQNGIFLKNTKDSNRLLYTKHQLIYCLLFISLFI
jgi:hypothetical protein